MQKSRDTFGVLKEAQKQYREADEQQPPGSSAGRHLKKKVETEIEINKLTLTQIIFDLSLKISM